VLTPSVNRTQLCRGVQHGHDPVERREGRYDGWDQEVQADVREVVKCLRVHHDFTGYRKSKIFTTKSDGEGADNQWSPR
jgi:hypothetical protein